MDTIIERSWVDSIIGLGIIPVMLGVVLGAMLAFFANKLVGDAQSRVRQIKG
ncbi:MAG: hypothetical protein WC742_02165 [Gallionellaceae bacterium]